MLQRECVTVPIWPPAITCVRPYRLNALLSLWVHLGRQHALDTFRIYEFPRYFICTANIHKFIAE